MNVGMKTTVVIPNYNGMAYIDDCLQSLRKQSCPEFRIIMVDNGSTDGSPEKVREEYPEVTLIRFAENKGFCKAVNTGIQAADTKYVILLNNDTRAATDYIKYLEAAIEQSERIFSVSARMLMMQEPDKIDDAGDLYCALGWAFARGKGKPKDAYNKACDVFAACGGAAIYRREVFETIGYFDENHFAYLEDIDIGYRARIYGYINRYEPKAEVLHAGSGFSGSRYNKFKVSLSSANSVYLIGKNMPVVQQIFNFPLLIAGFAVKTVFFMKKGLGGTYIKGLGKGVRLSFSRTGQAHKVTYHKEHLSNYLQIQLELWVNLVARIMGW